MAEKWGLGRVTPAKYSVVGLIRFILSVWMADKNCFCSSGEIFKKKKKKEIFVAKMTEELSSEYIVLYSGLFQDKNKGNEKSS